jgi:hypothetical protein
MVNTLIEFAKKNNIKVRKSKNGTFFIMAKKLKKVNLALMLHTT